jgi:hypothetical protein
VLVLSLLDFLRFAPSKRFVNAKNEWLFFIHPVMFTRILDGFIPPRGVQLNTFFLVLYIKEFCR